MPLPKKESLVIACKALNPFLNVDLLQKTPAGGIEPTPQAPGTPIDAVLKRLDALDQEYGLHTITFIVDVCQQLSRELGFSLTFGPDDLLNDQEIETIDDLARNLRILTTKLTT